MKKCILLLLFIASLNVGNAQIYVNVSAGGNNDGTTWANAYTDLQTAIDTAALNDEIWVAAGTYYPTASPDDVSTDPRDRAFHLGTNMEIYGGFAGGETQLSARNAAANITILSGDFDNDDDVTGGGSTLSFSNNTENAYHVIITANLTAAAVIDGFTIEGGHGDNGGAMTYQTEAFENSFGSGMANRFSSPTITNSTFVNNYAVNLGGAMFNHFSSSIITNSTFVSNYANAGGGMYNHECSQTITNSTFANNKGFTHGGALRSYNSSLIITNTIVWSNGSNEVATDNAPGNTSTLTFKNSIIKGSNGSGGSWNGAYGGDNGSNLDTDPLFVDAANGDYSLVAGSPAIDAGDGVSGSSANTTTLDLADNPRFDGIIDIGAYEYFNTVSTENQLPMINSIFNIYPNPVRYELTVNSTDIIERVIIYSALGQVVKQVIISDTQFSIDVSELPKGIYILQAQKADGQLVVKQFMK